MRRSGRAVAEAASWTLAAVAIAALLWAVLSWVRNARRDNWELNQEACAEECVRAGIYDTLAKCAWACQRWRP